MPRPRRRSADGGRRALLPGADRPAAASISRPRGREIDAALRANPSHADGWAERGLILTRQGDYAGAEAALQKALALDPDNYEATLHLAALYGRTRDPRRAAQEARLQTLVARRETRAQEFLRFVQAVP